MINSKDGCLEMLTSLPFFPFLPFLLFFEFCVSPSMVSGMDNSVIACQ